MIRHIVFIVICMSIVTLYAVQAAVGNELSALSDKYSTLLISVRRVEGQNQQLREELLKGESLQSIKGKAADMGLTIDGMDHTLVITPIK